MKAAWSKKGKFKQVLYCPDGGEIARIWKNPNMGGVWQYAIYLPLTKPPKEQFQQSDVNARAVVELAVLTWLNSLIEVTK